MKNTPIYTALLLAMPLCHAQEAPTAAVTPETPSIVESTETVEQNLVNAIIPLLKDLEAVNDKASADAIAIRMVQFDHLYEAALMNDNFDSDTFETLLNNAGFATDYVEKQSRRLREQNFYGSDTLRALLEGPGIEQEPGSNETGDEETEYETPSDEIKEEIGREFSKAVAEKGITVSGGPGLSPETAWIMDSGTADDIHLQYDILDCLPTWESEFQCNMGNNRGDLAYDAHIGHITYKDKTYELTIFFDISKYWLNQASQYKYEDNITSDTPKQAYTSEEQQAAITECVGIIKEVLNILKSVHDKDSADAAAEALKPLRARAEGLKDIMQYADDEIFEQLDEAFIMEAEDIADALEEKDYYGSEALRNVIR